MAVYLGKNSFLQLLQSVKRDGQQRIFLVTGRKSFVDSPARAIIFSFFSKKQISFFSDFSPNVKFEEALDGCRKFHASGADIIIAVGGGSVIDMAKIINVGPPDEAGLLNIIKGNGNIKPKAKLYCAPTTAGSGSEATNFAVIYVDGIKKSLTHKALLPDSIAVDPCLSASMPPYLTACSGFDALSQAIESYWAKGATPESRGLAKRAITLILPNIRNAVNSPTITIRSLMAEGSYLAGKAINISKTTAPHALSYYLTSKFSIPHGHAVALLLGHFFLINEKNTPKDLYSILGMASASDCCVFWYEMMKKCSLETSLIRLGVTQSNVDEIVLSVNKERLNNNPVFLRKKDLVNIIKKLF
jgi:alcohol dehydrogenase class IV